MQIQNLKSLPCRYAGKIQKLWVILIVGLLISSAVLVPVVYAYRQTDAINYLKSQRIEEWSVMALASSGALGGVNLDFLKNDPGSKATDIEKRILAIVAAGQNPETFGQVNLITKLTETFNGTEINAPANLLNDDIFGLLSLAAANKNPEIRQALAAFVKQNQNQDGGWSYLKAPSASDSNLTAMAIMALLANGEPKNSNILNDAFNYLATTKTATGYSFDATSGFGPDAASTAWVIAALLADEKSVSSSARAYLEGLQRTDGAFSWQENEPPSPLMTAYTVIALNNDFYPVKGDFYPTPYSTPYVYPTPQACNVAIHANKNTLLVGETVFLEAVGFTGSVSWQASPRELVTLNDSSAVTGKNTVEVTGLARSSVTIAASLGSCQAEIILVVRNVNEQPPTVSVTVLKDETQIFQGTFSLSSFSLMDNSGQVHNFDGPLAIGTIVEAARLGGFAYVVQNTALGLFVESVAGIGPEGTKGWLYAINGIKPSVGATQYVLNHNDKVIWFYGGPNDPIPEISPSAQVSISLSASIQSPPKPVIIFGVDTTNLDFGQLQAGEISADKQIRLTNDGTVNLAVTSSLKAADALYRNGLLLNTSLWHKFETKISAQTSKVVNVNLKVPPNYSSPGKKTGLLIFWATPN